MRTSLGYSPIWSPPAVGSEDPLFYKFSSVDLERVMLEIIGITAIGVIALVLTGAFKKESDST
jgi:hypothetical protein